MLTQAPDLVGGFMVQMLVTSVLILAVGGAAATRVFAQVQRLPGVMLVPTILVLMAIGVYVINGRVVDLWLMFGAGLAGYLMEKLEVPLAPIVLGMILGPMAEQGVRRALLIGRGDPLHLVSSPLSMIIAAATVGFILWPLLRRLKSTGRSDR